MGPICKLLINTATIYSDWFLQNLLSKVLTNKRSVLFNTVYSSFLNGHLGLFLGEREERIGAEAEKKAKGKERNSMDSAALGYGNHPPADCTELELPASI